MVDTRVIDSLEYNIKRFQELFDSTSYYGPLIEEKTKELEEKKKNIEFIKNTKENYIKALDVVYQKSIGLLKDTLNTALKYIIYDKRYSVDLQLDDKRGTKTLEILLIDEAKGFEAEMDDVGQGVRTIISFVLKYYYLMYQNSNILFLDEKYSALSAHYVPRFFEFILGLCKKNETKIVLITHDERFIEYATKTYLVNDGYIKVVEDETGLPDKDEG